MLKFHTSAIVLTLAVLLLPTQLFAQAQSDGYISGASQLRGKKILLIAGQPEKDHPNDDLLVKKHLEQQGYVATMGTEDDDPSKATGEDLILLSSSADPREIASKYADSAIPIFTWNTVDYP